MPLIRRALAACFACLGALIGFTWPLFVLYSDELLGLEIFEAWRLSTIACARRDARVAIVSAACETLLSLGTLWRGLHSLEALTFLIWETDKSAIRLEPLEKGSASLTGRYLFRG